MECLNCRYCNEDAALVRLPDGRFFVRVRRASKCKNYPRNREVSDSCRTNVFETEQEAMDDWNLRNG